MLVHVIVVLCVTQVTVQHVIVTTQGKVKGVTAEGYTSYIGIPYASVDSDAGRFKSPGLAPLWHGIRESQDPHCTAESDPNNCLQLDVHVPAGGRLPVLVWIKGGGGEYNAGELVKRGIIVVVVRHRFGPIGFLCSKKHKIPGNAGLKDVLHALRWVRDNIIAFHGNPHRVVIGGQSFGAAMAEALTLLPMARDLFHGVILQSGTILAPWAFNFDSEERASNLKIKFNRSLELTKVSTIDLVRKGEEIESSYLPFVICIEEPFRHEERLISESPFESLSKGEIAPLPMIIGYNNNEGYIFASALKEIRVLRKLKSDLSFILPVELQLNKKDLSRILKQINDRYFKDNITMDAVLNYHRDAYFLAHIYKSVQYHMAKNSVFFYQFSHTGKMGVESEPDLPKMGAAHSDELAYLFPDGRNDMDDDDKLVQRNLIEMWTNFVKHLNPNPIMGRELWQPVTPNNRLLNINTNMEIIDFPQAAEARVWDDIYDKYYRQQI